ncbi:MAG TPA: DinB family protein [Gemmatimonadales bacterium]|nr:DinB family protein [Gemmatimonadales bacterium]
MFGGLEAAVRQFESTKHEAAELVASLTDAQVNWRPAPGRWSIGECLLHLATSTDAALPALDLAIERAQVHGWTACGPYHYGWFTRWNVRSMEPPPAFRMRTFRIFEPPATAMRGGAVARALAESRDRLLERTRVAAGVDLKRAIVVSPAMRLFRLPLGGYLAFLAAHDRRHLWQARQVLQASGFGQR